MSEKIRDIATVTFSGGRFEGPGIEPEAFSFLIRYRDLLLAVAEALRGVPADVRMKFYPLENPPGVAIRQRVVVDEGCMISVVGVPNAVDDAAELIDVTLDAIRDRRLVPSAMPKRLMPKLAALAESVEQGDTITVQAAWSKVPGVLTWGMRLKLHSHKTVEPEEPEESGSQEDSPSGMHVSDSLRLWNKRANGVHDAYDDSAPLLWKAVVALGASLSNEDWKDVPPDLAQNLDHYLYGTASET